MSRLSVDGEIRALVFSGDCSTLAVGACCLSLIDSSTGTVIDQVYQVPDYQKVYDCLAFSRDNSCLLGAHDTPGGSIIDVWRLDSTLRDD